MQCPHCGAPVDPGVRFCPSCRKRVVAPSEGFGNTPPSGTPAPPPPRTGAPPPSYQAAPASGYQPQVAAALFPPYTVDMRRPGIVTAMAILDLIGGAFGLLGAAAVLIAALTSGQQAEAPLVMVAIGGLYAIIGLVYVAAGVGLLQMKSWARILQIVLACLGILSCGIIISVLMLIYLFKPGVKVLFSGKTAEDLSPQEAADVAQLKGGSTGVVIAIVLVVVLMMVAMIGIIAAIAIPSLLRAKISANEANAIGNVRSMISAEAAYQSANAGYYDVPACLVAPAQCLAAPAPSPFLIPGALVFDAPKSGYVQRFYPGESATAPGASPSSLRSFATVAEPASPQGGVRTFCGDATGIVCMMSDGEHDATGGQCPQSCRPLR